MNNIGWTCPKCGNSYAPFWFECTKCNAAPKEQGAQPEQANNTARDAIAICDCLATYDESKFEDHGGIPSLIKRAFVISQRHP